MIKVPTKNEIILTRAFVFVMSSIFIMYLLFSSKGELYQAVEESNSRFLFNYFALVIITFSLYILTWKNPGFVLSNSNDKNNLQPIHQQETNELDRFEIVSSTDTSKNDCEQNHVSILNENKNLSANQLRFCEKCKIWQPLRSKHCKICDRCVRRYDHHCTLIGNCVGERNHFIFTTYLCFKSILSIWTINMLSNCFTSEKTLELWFKNNFILLILFAIILFATLFILILAIIHVFLSTKNSTTWEMEKRNRITYLKDLPSDFNPFYYGVFKNLKFFIIMTWRKIDWVPYTYKEKLKKDREKSNFEKKCDLFCENDYYSCC
ncbi:palmitoyltransferase zdhhc12-related [Anaeramoeba flamelloides]|uniref:Palmitoyltransferase n=1 Tax=Anaeramoeba flamelloides TaxID=1746091 RepID=A0AAV8AFH6_9EUKA|nr:palmitoyltransferase zdhhc12-related [Anaeramoeba flamelloides]KAJ6237168.1 palmitoyltransferase zdhhc12-related [Anaeramoeba flamelloides]